MLPPALLNPSRRRGATLAGLASAVLLLHAWLLGALPEPGPGGAGPAPHALQVRQIAAPPRPAPLQEAAVVAEAAAAARPHARAAAAAPRAATTAASPAASAPAATAPEGVPAEAPATGGEPVPVYATRPPPAVTLQFAVVREGVPRPGLQAELRWLPATDGRYTLTLGLAAAGWASVGALDAHGLAPERQVETRRGREQRAVNFQRDSGRISFSGPTHEFALLPGAQDRLSWLVQLAAVLEAEPALAEAGRELALFVAGPRGDGARWTFTSHGLQSVALADGSTREALRLQREPQRPYDTRVDLWLDPARHHLPLRLVLQNRVDGEATEFRLLAMQEP